MSRTTKVLSICALASTQLFNPFNTNEIGAHQHSYTDKTGVTSETSVTGGTSFMGETSSMGETGWRSVDPPPVPPLRGTSSMGETVTPVKTAISTGETAVMSDQPEYIKNQQRALVGKWKLDSLQITKIIVGSATTSTVEYEQVREVVDGIFDAVVFETNRLCKLTVDAKSRSASYTMHGNILTIRYDNESFQYTYHIDDTIIKLTRDCILQKPSDDAYGYKLVMVFRQ